MARAFQLALSALIDETIGTSPFHGPPERPRCRSPGLLLIRTLRWCRRGRTRRACRRPPRCTPRPSKQCGQGPAETTSGRLPAQAGRDVVGDHIRDVVEPASAALVGGRPRLVARAQARDRRVLRTPAGASLRTWRVGATA